jgi:site-specific recombinase XerD
VPAVPQANSLPFPVAVDQFLQYIRLQRVSANTLAAYIRDIEQIGELLTHVTGCASTTNLDLAAVTVQDLRDAFDLYGQQRKATTVLRAHACWSKFFTVMVQDNLLPASAMAGVPKPPAAKRLPKPLRDNNALEAILTAAATPPPGVRQAWPTRDVALILLLGGAGLRSGETRALRVRDLMDSVDGWLLRVRGKGNKDRILPLPAGIAARVHAYVDDWDTVLGRLASPNEALFQTLAGFPMTKNQMEYRFKQIVAAAGMQSALDEGAALHALRHTFATRAIQDGVPATRLQALLGHESLTTTQLYVKVSDAELRAEVEGTRAARLTEILPDS